MINVNEKAKQDVSGNRVAQCGDLKCIRALANAVVGGVIKWGRVLWDSVGNNLAWKACMGRHLWKKWVNRDPIAEIGGINLYRFVNDNPISRIDPRWESWYSKGVGVAFAALGLDLAKDAASSVMNNCKTESCCEEAMAAGLAALQGGLDLGLSQVAGESEFPPAAAITLAGLTLQYFFDISDMGNSYNACMDRNKPKPKT